MSSHVRQNSPKVGPAGSLTVRDLLEIRDYYQAALANMPNVVGTALGWYRFRDLTEPTDVVPREPDSSPKTLANSRTRVDSMPSILVFVRQWQAYGLVSRSPRDVVPQFLYLADGRAAPTCVIGLDLDQNINGRGVSPVDVAYPENVIGGGCGVFTRVQSRKHFGTIACLTTDGERTYGLTARHVVGAPGQPIYTYVRGEEHEIGQADAQQARKVRFTELYPGYPGANLFTNLDAGFVRIEDADRWTYCVRGLGELGDMVDLGATNITLDLVGLKVCAFGAVSKDRMKGEICGLFPRYRSMGGSDYLADVLISARDGQMDDLHLAPGDSGALWVVEPSEDASDGRPRPLAVTWGSVDLVGGGTPRQLALGTYLSSICKTQDMELVTPENIGYRPVWGQENHLLLARVAASIAKANGSDWGKFLAGTEEKRAEVEQLAYVPDRWKREGKRGAEGPNHYANSDLVLEKGSTLERVPLSYAKWLAFYEALQKKTGIKNRGILPFRIGQTYDALVAYLEQGDWRLAFAAAGVMIHYVSDACNPAHVSRFGRGEEDWPAGYRSSFHSLFDNPMLDESAITAKCTTRSRTAKISNGPDAARLALRLMVDTRKKVDVAQFIVPGDRFESKRQASNYCNDTGLGKLAACAAGGIDVLGALWSSAWKKRKGNPAKRWNDVTGLADEVLHDLEFIPSLSLEELARSNP